MRKEKKEAWFRIVVLIVSGIILKAWGALICILAVLNFFIVLFSGKRSRKIAKFCEFWNTEYYRFFRYLTFVRNERPFPFTSMQRLSAFE